MDCLIDEDEMLDVLRNFVREAGTQKAAADRLGISATFMSDMVKGRMPISGSVAKKLGYQRSWWYRRTLGETN